LSSLPEEEVRQRLAAITEGPWADGLVEARRRLAPRGPLRAPTGAGAIALDRISLSDIDRRKSRQLATVLRAHFNDPITDEEEQDTRDALDEALTVPQLYELAVQTGYLPAEEVRRPARRILKDLLWSAPARGFVATYDYVAVPMLAARVGVSGLGPVQPPQTDPNSALRFAGFLAHLRAFHADQGIQTWTGFLDDYIQEKNEQDKLWRYLRGERQTGPARSAQLLGGCQLFVASLAGAFHVLDDDELGRFGLIHAYWLQKFFGYKLDDRGYVKNVALWGASDSWAHTVAASPRLVPPEADARIARLLRQKFVEQVGLLERVFAAVRALAKFARHNAPL
jgi:hypothetical protein